MSAVAPARPMTSSKEVDCAREPIHIPGGIQPHGFLFSVDAEGLLLQASANISLLNGRPAEASLGQPLQAVLGKDAAMVLDALRGLQAEGTPLYAGSIEDPRGAAHSPLAVVVHRHLGINIVELEPARGTADVFSSMYPLVRTFINSLHSVQTVAELALLAAREIQRITGYGRTKVYSFDAEGAGHVIAEALEPGYPSYLDQRFPASDIPAQARALYVRNRIRLIADADYVPVPLVPARHPVSGGPTDLTYASLRSVSPVHVQYMKNMRTLSSMSMSIVVRGRLWGLISCHHHSARVAPFEVRTACEHVAQVLSLQIEAKEDHAEAEYRLELRHTLSRLLASMANTDSFVDALRQDPRDLLGLTGSTGAAIVFNGRVERVGEAPDEAAVAGLVQWLDTQPGTVYATDHVAGLGAAVLPRQPECAGFLAVSISKLFRNYVIWFRAEVVRTIKWAGDPRDKLSGLSPSLSPRESFEVWTEQVRDHSAPWRTAEQEIAVEFQTALLGVVLRRAEEMAQLALELGRVNKELEGFSYTVSHDLRAPLRHILAYMDLIREEDGARLSERSAHYMERIAGAARFGGQLVDDLLAFSQMSRAALRLQTVDVAAMVGKLAEDSRAEGAARVEWAIGELGTVTADPVLLHVVLQNLVENALKFSSRKERPRIEIGRRPGEGELAGQDVFWVRDNGVGFDMAYVGKLFGVFERLHQQEEFSGTGIGLASVRRVVERHGGRAWAEGMLDHGACIYFSLPRSPAAPAGAGSDETAAETLARLVALSPDRRRQPVLKDTKEGT